MKRSDFESYLKTAAESSTYILSNLHRAADLIRSFKQVAADQSNEEQRKFKVKDYINKILLSLRPKLKKTKHVVKLECPDDLEIISYPGAFSQIMTNLVMNSLIHGFDGIEEGQIQINIPENEENLEIQYSDSGRGMDDDTLKNIFNPFFTTRRGHGGTGLGMHIVFNVVSQKLGGHISAESVLNNGTVFKISIPRKQETYNELQLKN